MRIAGDTSVPDTGLKLKWATTHDFARLLKSVKGGLTVDFIIQHRAWDLLRPALQKRLTSQVRGSWAPLAEHLAEWSTISTPYNPRFPLLRTFFEEEGIRLLYPDRADGREWEDLASDEHQALAKAFWDGLSPEGKVALADCVRTTHRGDVPAELRSIFSDLDMPVGEGLPEYRDFQVSCTDGPAGPLGPAVAVGVQGDAGEAQTMAPLLELGGQATGRRVTRPIPFPSGLAVSLPDIPDAPLGGRQFLGPDCGEG
jgi:hypothetical protein